MANHPNRSANRLFRPDNCEGYTPAQMEALNAEASERLARLEPGSDEYEVAAKAFCDEVAGR